MINIIIEIVAIGCFHILKVTQRNYYYTIASAWKKI